MLQSLRRRRDHSELPVKHIRVRGGYQPDTVHAVVGERVLLTFRREETAPCSERVVFPAFGKSAMLPAYQDVTVELRPERAGSYEFTCQMGMLRGRLVVEERSDS
jgi:plastocyanin domain-containing protein